jgi:dsRNA-specific ribonuclease
MQKKKTQTDDNYKNKLQVIIQKEFKITPEYIELNHDLETGYEMGVYICLGQEIYEVKVEEAIDYKVFGSFTKIQEELNNNDKIFIFLGKGQHKIKKKAEQIACEEALKQLTLLN